MTLWWYDALVIPAVLGGFLLAGLYGDVVVGAVISGIIVSLETAARLAQAVLGRAFQTINARISRGKVVLVHELGRVKILSVGSDR